MVDMGAVARDAHSRRLQSSCRDPSRSAVPPAWGRTRVQSTLELVIYEVVTDDGLVGVGAASGGHANAVAMDRLVTPHLIGQDPTDIERLAGIIRDAEIMGLRHIAWRFRFGTCLARPLGCRSFVCGAAPPIAFCLLLHRELQSAQARAEDVGRLAEAGFTAVKLRFHAADPRDDVAVAEAVRAEVGDTVELMVDANQASADPGSGGHRVCDFRTALGVARDL